MTLSPLSPDEGYRCTVCSIEVSDERGNHHTNGDESYCPDHCVECNPFVDVVSPLLNDPSASVVADLSAVVS